MYEDEGDVLNWDEGNEGKGLITTRGHVHTWNTDEFETHWDYIHHLDDMNQVETDEYFWIEPEGKVSSAGVFPLRAEFIDLITEADPRLHGPTSDPSDGMEPTWNFQNFGANLTDEIMGQLGIDPNAPKPKPYVPPTPEEQRARWNEGLDNQLKYDDISHPHVQHVPIEELKPMMEFDRRPGAPMTPQGEQQAANPQYYEDLKNHIKQHGMLVPTWIDYDPETQHGHISEGNHRLAIAEELGLTHVPVRAYRSRRKSQGGSRHLPQGPRDDPQADGGRGNWVPEFLKASDLGLPVR